MSTDLLSLFGAIQRGDTQAIASHLFPSPSSSDGQHGRKSALCGAQHELSGEERPHTGPGTAGAGTSARCKSCGAPLYALYDSCTQCLVAQTPVYPVTCRARYYDAASRILEEELGMHTHANADELGHVIQKWIEETREI